MPSARKLSLRRESLAELMTDELSEIAGNDWSGNPFCIVSIGPCVTVLCSNLRPGGHAICLAPINVD